MDFDASYTKYQANRSWLRRWLRKIYLNSAASQLTGPTLDFGCGIGELLERLPLGSRGLEYNFATVELCRSRGLAVDRYDGLTDDWQLTVMPHEVHFDSMVISHVLEHLENPMAVLHSLLRMAASRNIHCVLVIVPGKAGYRIDATHRTFVDHEMLSRPDVVAGTGFRLDRLRYFPGNWHRLGEWFPHHELQVLYRRH